MLMKNFVRAYEGNTRAPFGLYMHAAWFFGQEWHYEGYKMFLEEITSGNYDNVWVVPVIKGLEYRYSGEDSSFNFFCWTILGAMLNS